MELLYEPSKRITLFGIFLVGLIGAINSFVPTHSKFLEPMFEAALPSSVLMIILFVGFVTLSITSLLLLTVPRREQKYQKMINDNGQDMSFNKEKVFNTKLTKIQKSREANKKFTIFFAAVSILSFVFVLCTGPFVFTHIELNKPLIEKTIGDFRLYMDVFCWSSFVISLIGFFVSSPYIIRNRKFFAVAIYIFIAAGILSTAHFTYFCLGHFTSYPSIEDGSVAFISLLMVIFEFLSIKTEKKKFILKQWKDNNMMIYDF